MSIMWRRQWLVMGAVLDADYNQTKYFLAVLEKHHVTEAVFDSSLVYYYTHAERLKDIYLRVQDTLGQRRQETGSLGGRH